MNSRRPGGRLRNFNGKVAQVKTEHYSVNSLRPLLRGLLGAGLLLLLIQGAGLAEQINYKSLYKKTAPGVVRLWGSNDGRSGWSGTGSIIHESGLVLTNAHVVTKNDRPLKIIFVYLKPEKITGNRRKDLRRSFQGKTLAVHPAFDLALVQIIQPPPNLKVLHLSGLAGIEIGEPTVAIGHPGGGAPWTLTTGQISASWEDYHNVRGRDVFQTNTDINPGNSGGPLLDGTGSIIGINTFIVRRGRGGLALTGLNFSVKSTTALNWISSVRDQLPVASAIKPAANVTPPKPEQLEKAVPPKLKETPRAAKPFVAQPKNFPKGRKLDLRQGKRRPREGFTTKAKPGESYGGDKELEAFFKRVDAAFEGMERDLDKAFN